MSVAAMTFVDIQHGLSEQSFDLCHGSDLKG
jgi:hypothetical protein